MKKLLSLLLVLVLLLGVLPGAVFAEDEGAVDFVVLSTTDMHGKCWDKNVLTEGNENNTMLRVSTAVSQLRETFGENLLLIDNGDLYQGTPVSTVQLGKITSGESTDPPAMALCLGDIGYDVSVLGNHEFNYPWTTMTKAYDYLATRGVPIITANLYYDGTDGVHEAGENVFTPYLVKTFTVNGTAHKIGVLGFENTDCTRWDVPDNYPGILFSHPDNPQRSIAWEAQRWIPQMQAEGCEFIIVSYHSGTGSASGDLVFGQNTEGQVTRLIAECEGIDMVIAGHDHSNAYSNTYLPDKNGKDVLVVNGGGTQLTKAVFSFSEDADGKLQYTVKEAVNLGLSAYAVDQTLKEKIAPYAAMAEEYVNQVAGYAVGEWDTSHNYYLEQTDTIDLINEVQRSYGSKYLAIKYDTAEKQAALYAATGLDHIDVDVSAASPVTSNNYYVKPGEITMKTIVQMYKYDNNVLYILPLTGQQIKDVLEQNAATRLKASVKNGVVTYSAIGDNFTNVVFGGLNFTYDMYQPEGSRVIITGLSNGRDFALDQTYIVACNSYHLGNTGCGFGAYTPDDSIWNQNNDLGGSNIQEAILEYIQEKGEITTDPFTWTWALDYTGDPSAPTDLTGAFAAEKITAEDLQPGDQIVIYYDADSTVIGLDPAEDDRRLAPVETTSFQTYIAASEKAAVFTLGVADAENGYYTLESEKGYLTAGATGNSLGFGSEAGELAQWYFVPAEGGYHIMSVGAAYNGNHNQAIEWYSGFTTYGVKDTAIYLFNLYRVAETARLAEELTDGRQYVIYYNEENLCVADTANSGGLGSVQNTVSGDFLMLPAAEHTLIVTANIDAEGRIDFVTADGKHLTSKPTGNGVSLTDEPADNDCSLWTPVPVEGGFHVMNVGANYNDNHNQALEYYGGKFTTYGVSDSGAFLFNFYELAAGPVEPPVGDLSGKTVILHTNDTHGALMGFAQVAAVKAEFEAKGANVILVDAGDYSQGNTYVSTSKGATAIEMMNAAGYDVATLGNHEFDFGFPQLMQNFETAEFMPICADVYNKETGDPILPAYFIKEVDGVKIGFFGMETPETQTKVNPGLIKEIEFGTNENGKFLSGAQHAIAALKIEGADLIIGLVHLGVDAESEPYRSVDLYNEIKDDVDFLIDGHSHTVMTEGPNGEPIQSTGTKASDTALMNVGMIQIDNATKTIEKNELIPLGADAPVDMTVAAVAQEIMDAVNAEYGAVFARSDVELNGDKAPGNRNMETNLGDLITDALKWSVLKDMDAETLGVPEENVVAVTNGGGIRAWIHKGDVTRNNVNTVLPFGNTVAVVYVTGAELLEALEASTYCTPTAVGGFPQISGMNIRIDTMKSYDKGELYPESTYYGPASIRRVTIKDVNGKPFDPEATYAVVTNNFCAAGGDTYYAFKAASEQFDTGIPMDEALMGFILEPNFLNGVISDHYAEPQGRIEVWEGFDDVQDPGKYYYVPVYWAYDHEPQITAGIGDNLFGRKETCTRAQIVTFLWKAFGEPEHHMTENPFTDVKAGKWYYDAVMWAYENDITHGVGDGLFGVNETCNRGDAMTFLWIAAGKPEPETTENPFEDVREGKYYYKAVLWALENGITTGTSETTFSPKQTCTRAQIITFLYLAN